ncbi:MAG: hypothetical protein WAV83_09675, partial [Methanothrix sp.]|uniref:DUF7507 domain-containing protein n=1 Tax=Methanothrix sp. TaxID=90426 RepID=UPI003BB156FF
KSVRKMALELKGWWAFAAIAALLIPSAMGFPGLNLTKNCSTISANVDEIIVYSFDLKNNGTEKITNPMIIDDHLGEIPVNKSTLDIGESCVVLVSYKVMQSDLPGPLVNVARARAEWKGGEVVSNDASFAVSLGIVGYENLSKYGYSIPESFNI